MQKHAPSFDELKRTYDLIMQTAVDNFNGERGEVDLAAALFIVDIRPGERVRVAQFPDHLLLPFYDAEDRDELTAKQHLVANLIRSILVAPDGPGGIVPNAVYLVTHGYHVTTDRPDRTGKPRELSEWDGSKEVIMCNVHTLNGTYLGTSVIDGEPRHATKGELNRNLLHGPFTMTRPEQQRAAMH
jgi:hypothetical protein